MKKILSIMLLAVMLAAFTTNSNAEITAKKYEKISGKVDSKNIVQYGLGCTVYYDENLQPCGRVFSIIAQNSNYKELEDVLSLFSWLDAQKAYDELVSIYNFSKDFKEDRVKVSKEKYQIENVKMPLLGWYTYIYADGGYHQFKTKDFKKMIKDLVKYCEKNGIEITTQEIK